MNTWIRFSSLRSLYKCKSLIDHSTWKQSFTAKNDHLLVDTRNNSIGDLRCSHFKKTLQNNTGLHMGKLESFYFSRLQEKMAGRNTNGNSGIDSLWKNLSLSMVLVLSLDCLRWLNIIPLLLETHTINFIIFLLSL